MLEPGQLTDFPNKETHPAEPIHLVAGRVPVPQGPGLGSALMRQFCASLALAQVEAVP